MDLIAQGGQSQHRWRRQIPEGVKFVLGRTAPGWAVRWDEHVSRRHVELELRGDVVELARLHNARNPVYVDGEEVEQAVIEAGHHFVIGRTTFTLANTRALVSIDDPVPIAQQKYSAQHLRGMRYRDADQRNDGLSRLPDVIQGASTDQDLFSGVVNVLLQGVPRCDAVAIVNADNDHTSVQVLHWDGNRLGDRDFRPSERLIRQTVASRVSVIHLWHEHSTSSSFTQRDDMDWAFCTPLPGKACAGWALYVAGRSARDDDHATPGLAPSDFHDDLKFAETTAAMLGNLRDVKQLERDNAALGQFFSPVVLDVLTVEDPEVVLAPREQQVSVMFCDLRGFSLHAEQSADDLFGLLDRVSQALGVMTRQILDEAGVVGDFQGDSVMGFWGWPLAQDDAAVRACRAALSIRRELENTGDNPEHPLTNFGLGIGIATGTAVAGKIGTTDQFKVTVFGPVVNLASRLEGMTKPIGAAILIDEATRRIVAAQLPADFGRIRRLAAVQPSGLTQSVLVAELLLGIDGCPEVSDEQVQATEACFDLVVQRDWVTARSCLARLSPHDTIRGFLSDLIEQRTGQQDWDGVIRFPNK